MKLMEMYNIECISFPNCSFSSIPQACGKKLQRCAGTQDKITVRHIAFATVWINLLIV